MHFFGSLGSLGRGGLVLVACLASLSACSELPRSGPTTGELVSTPESGRRFALVDVDSGIASKMRSWTAASMKGTFGYQGPASSPAVGVGDSVQVVIWEAASGGLFSAPASDRIGPGSRSALIPEQTVGQDGAITVPYAGRVRVLGRAPAEIEQAIVSALAGKAIEPQALVTVTKNVANTVTVIGEVTGGARVPLTSRGDRVLDVVAQAGGTKAPAYDTYITLMRGTRSVRMPLQAILADPSEDVYVRPGDVVSVAREQQTFTSAGATGQNAVIPFDAVGITLDQAIAKAGGLNDMRADPTGVFVIRYERPEDYDRLGLTRPTPEPLPEIPVIYRVNLRDPNGFFVAQRFPVHNKDVLFVSNARGAELQKVMSILLPFLGVGATAVAVTAAIR